MFDIPVILVDLVASVFIRFQCSTFDHSDGKNLIKLCEIIGNDELKQPVKGVMKIHKIQNLNSALHYVASKGVKLVGISAEGETLLNVSLIHLSKY